MIELSKKQFYQMRKHAGVCVDCGKEDAYTMAGRARCAECAERVRINQERYCEDPEKRQLAVDRTKARRHARKSAGLCPMCGKKPMAGHVKCMECTLRQRKANTKNRGRSPRLDRVCWQCNKQEPIPGKKLCPDCYPSALAKLDKANRVRLEREIYPYWSDKGKAMATP